MLPSERLGLSDVSTTEEHPMSTRWKIFAAFLSLWLLQGAALAETDNPDGYRLSEPVLHGNLAIYFVRGKSRGGPVPLTLQEAMAKRIVEVREIGRVNEVQVENAGNEEVFIQAGDIVKGGQQDRVLSVSLMLPPRSGAVSVASYCVESGRWSARAGEDAQTFSSSNAIVPSRRAKLEIAGASAARPDAASGSRQQEVWKSVAQMQGKLSSNLATSVVAPRSQTSLQLSLENGRLQREQAEYLAAIEPQGERDDDILGYAFAVNGKMSSADIYPSNGLFRKMWPKLLRASVTEAISDRDAGNEPAPPVAAVNEFISQGSGGVQAVETHVGERMRIRVNDGAKVISLESRPAAAPPAAWMHRTYIAK
jgi:hypothetical protein